MYPRADSVVDNLIACQDDDGDDEEAESTSLGLQTRSQRRGASKENLDTGNVSKMKLRKSKDSDVVKSEKSESKSDSDALLYVSNEMFDKIISNANNSEENSDVYLSCQEVETQDGRMLMMTTDKDDLDSKEFKSPLEACLDYDNSSSTSGAILEPPADFIESKPNFDEQNIPDIDPATFDKIFDPYNNYCLICDQKFEDIGTYRVHYNNNHASKDKSVLHCWECKLDFKKARDYVNHKDSLHVDGDNICVICGELLATSRSLQTHLNAHLNKQTYECNTCRRIFRSHSSRQDHIRNKHLRPKNTAFMCKHCGSHFQHGRSLVRHVNCVHAKQRVVCQTCNKSYSSISSLYYHQRTIHEKVAFHCGYCSKAFRSVSAIKKHENEMHHEPSKFRGTPTEKTYNYNQYVTHQLNEVKKKENPTLHIKCMFCKAEYYDHEAYAKHYNKFHCEENVDIRLGSTDDAKLLLRSTAEASHDYEDYDS